jgi:peptide/nickel transport system ATP-binding protein
MEKHTMVEIEDLYVNFYTQAGVVKAIDGVNLKLYRGETFGLVGETGCGKSVTANCIMRLIPQPPGKIEKGRIYFVPPNGSDEEIAELESKISEMRISAGAAKVEKEKNRQQKGQKKKEGDKGDDISAQIARLEQELEEMKEISSIKREMDGVKNLSPSPEREKRISELNLRRSKVLSKYDLLARSKEYMQRIRGKYISMIFQEPMSALNPVFTAGFQISEVLLLHERRELAQSALRRIEEDQKYLKEHKKVGRKRNAKNEFECMNCKAIVPDGENICPNCSNYFDLRPLKQVSMLGHAYSRTMLRRIIKNPDKWLSKRVAKRVMKWEALDRSERMLRLVRIPDPQNVVHSFPHELSGGMQQRVMIAMALACRPQLLIADEPTTALDVTIQAQIIKLMRELQEETGTSILMITHNLGVVAEMCDRVGVMYAGAMAEVGPKFAVFKEPLHPYTQGLINSIPKVNMDLPRLETIDGNVPNLARPPSGCRFHPRCPYAMEICTKEKPPMVEIRPGHMAACHLYTGVQL